MFLAKGIYSIICTLNTMNFYVFKCKKSRKNVLRRSIFYSCRSNKIILVGLLECQFLKITVKTCPESHNNCHLK